VIAGEIDTAAEIIGVGVDAISDVIDVATNAPKAASPHE
jgi:hypothetical protein